MKKLYLLFLLATPLLLEAQTVNKYLLVEHFTNTYCGICSSRNPALYTVMEKYPDEIHHIAIHPPVPYDQCPLYRFNEEDNGARRDYYGVPATPTMYINGVRSSSSSSSFEQNLLSQMNAPAALSIQVEESGFPVRAVTLTITTHDNIEAANHKLFVAVVEERLLFDANNGESEHHDVLRDYVTASTGDDVTPAPVGESVVLNYEIDIPDGVDPTEVYVLAYVQDQDTKEILNSGTKFDEQILGVNRLAASFDLVTFPNPASEVLEVQVGADHAISAYRIYNQLGQEMTAKQLAKSVGTLSVDLLPLASGSYVLEVLVDDTPVSAPFLKR